jgi:hypothetical protein
MPETWIYVIGGIIVGVIAFVIAYNLISSSIEYSKKQSTLTQFFQIATDINSVCLQEMSNSIVDPLSISSSVRVVYVTDNINTTLPKVVDQIKNQQLSYGQYICIQFKDEQYLRCHPENPEEIFCKISMPYMGALPESEDIWVKVSKILTGYPQRDYKICIKKIGYEDVNISFDADNCEKPISIIQTTTTTIGQIMLRPASTYLTVG